MAMAVRTNRIFTLDEVAARFENWRQNRRRKASIPDELGSTAVEVAGKKDWTGLQTGCAWSGTSWSGAWRPQEQLRGHLRIRCLWTDSAPRRERAGVHDRDGRPARQAPHLSEKHCGGRSGEPEPDVVGGGILIQITPQVKILVAVEPIDARKGIDSLAQLCRGKLDADPCSGCLFLFRSRSGRAIRILTYDGQGFWMATKRLSKGRFPWWPTGSEPAKTLQAHQAQLLLAAGKPDTEAGRCGGA
jgi:transposase